jgi:predicted amidohydrolase YtcJ
MRLIGHVSFAPSIVCVSLTTLLLWTAALGAADDSAADLVIRGGKIITMDPASPVIEAVAVQGSRIVAVGDDEAVEHLIRDDTRVMQLGQAIAIPGFIEGHGHFVSLGRSKMILDLTVAKTWDDVVRLVKQAADTTPRSQWIVGRGWHQGKWTARPDPNVEGYPVHVALSNVTPMHPVMLTHGTGHMCLANAVAMELAGVNNAATDAGGEILRDADGQPTGVFRENAMGIIQAAYGRSQGQRSAQERRSELIRAIELGGRECLRYGVTTFHDAGASFATIDVFRELAEQDKLPIRLYVMVGEGNDRLAAHLADYRMIGVGRDHLTVRAIKRLVDGALGTHGAWLLEPYDDLPTSRGLNTLSMSSLRRTAELAIEHDFQLCVHAIGDRANRETLDVFQDAMRRSLARTDLRWRIEHAQHLHPVDIPRFTALGVIASMQGVHCTSDAPFVVRRLGQRRARQGAYAWRSLLKAGATIVNGTDVPVERLDPIACFYSSVTRRPDGQDPFFPEQRMTRSEALRSYTQNAAYAGFEEELKGSLTLGKLADIVILSQDLLTVAEDRIRDTQVLATIVGGQVLYEVAGSRLTQSPRRR